MKHITHGVVLMMIIALFITAWYTIDTRQQRETEVYNSLDGSIKETVSNLMMSKKYSLYGNDAEEIAEEFIADFAQLLVNDIQAGEGSNADRNLNIKIEVAGIDVSKGLLSIKVTETFSYPMVGTGEVVVPATVVFDTVNETEKCVVTFYNTDDSILAQYTMESGNTLVFPTASGTWYTDQERTTVASTSSVKVTGDLNYYLK